MSGRHLQTEKSEFAATAGMCRDGVEADIIFFSIFITLPFAFGTVEDSLLIASAQVHTLIVDPCNLNRSFT